MSSSGDSSVVHEKSFHDALLRVMESAQRPADTVEVHLAGPLVEFFYSWPLKVLLIHAEPYGTEFRPGPNPDGVPHFHATRFSGANAEFGLVESMDEGAVGELVEQLETAPQRHLRHQRVVELLASGPPRQEVGSELVGTEEEGWRAMVLWSAARRADGAIHLQEAWIVFGVENPPDNEQVRWFHQHRTSRDTLLKHLMALRAQRQLPDLTQQVREIVTGEGERLVDRLQKAERVLRIILWEQSFHGTNLGYLGLAEDLGTWVVQALLGTGWGVRSFGGNAGKASAEGIAASLQELANNLGGEPPDTVHRLAGLAHILWGALFPRGDAPGFTTLQLSPWQQLAAWTRMQEIARAVAKDRDDWLRDDDLAWEQLGTQSLVWLAQTLADPDHDGPAEIRFGDGDLADNRIWLRLWFCHQLLGRLLKGPDPRVTGTLTRQLRADLAYVLRESLRLRLFGRRSDYSFQPAAFASALRTLIEYHSVYAVGLSAGHDIARHLYEVAEATHPDRVRFAAGHLQHVLEMYIAGHFLCSLEIQDEEHETCSMAGILAARGQSDMLPGPQTITDFLQSFSLAVLFHDVGLVLFPDLAPPNERIAREERDLLAALRAVQATLESAGRELVARCAEELRRAGWIDLGQDPALSRWLEDQLASGEPDHALLGAWYLHCTCRSIPELNPEVVRDSVRAVLLHGVPTRPIAVDGDDSDPVAALLVLCDELFEWLPAAAPGASPNTVGKSRHALAAEERPLHSRARRIRVRDLTVTCEGSEVHASVKVDRTRRTMGWPALDLVLEPTEFQDVPIYETWIGMTQNLRRIRRSQVGWGPVVTVYAEVPARLRDLRLGSTRELLERVVRSPHARQLPFASSLEVWLSDSSRFPVPAEETGKRHRDSRLREQCLVIRSEGRAFHPRDVRPWFNLLLEVVRRVLTELEGGRRTKAISKD